MCENMHLSAFEKSTSGGFDDKNDNGPIGNAQQYREIVVIKFQGMGGSTAPTETECFNKVKEEDKSSVIASISNMASRYPHPGLIRRSKGLSKYHAIDGMLYPKH